MSSSYVSYRRYIVGRFGGPVLKVPLNAGFSCPNRDGTRSTAGCSFCDNRSFSPVALDVRSVLGQLKTSIERARGRFTRFIAYLQPFSNTHGTVEQLRFVYEPILAVPCVVGLAVGTRPDCFEDKVLAYLADVSERTYLSVELGLQSACDDVLFRNNRGHTCADFEHAVTELAGRRIEVVAHVILGLPGNTRDSMIETARKLASLPVAGVKIHQLMVIAGTEVAAWHRAGEVTALDLKEYALLLSEFLGHLRPDQHIHRIMADSTLRNGLVAPLWSADKPGSITFLRKYMREHHVRQGDLRG